MCIRDRERQRDKMKLALMDQTIIDRETKKKINYIKHEVSLNKQSREQLEGTIQAMSDKLKILLEATESQINTEFSLALFVIHCHSILEDVNHKVNNLKIAISESNNGKLSKIIMSKITLREEITKISTVSRKLTPVFAPLNIERYYKLETTSLTIRSGKLRVFTRIPLINPSHTMTIKKIDMRTKIESGTGSDYILISSDHPTYTTISAQDLRNFIYIEDFGYISSKRQIEIFTRNNLTPNEHLKIFDIEEARKNYFTYKSLTKISITANCKKNFTNYVLPYKGEIYVPEYLSLIHI